MISTKAQLFFLKKGLNLKESFLLCSLLEIAQPIRFSTLLLFHPLLDIKQRQYCQILEKMVQLNLITKNKTPQGLFIKFPYICTAKKCRFKASKTCNKLHIQTPLTCKKMHNINGTNKNIFNNLIINNFHDVVNNKTVVQQNKNNLLFIQAIKSTFKQAFPEKNNFIKDNPPPNFNVNLLITKIKQSPFLQEKSFVNLNWCIKNYDAIVCDYYKPFVTQPQPSVVWQNREYTPEFFNSLFNNLDDVEL